MGRVVKRAFKFRFYPTEQQAAELARTFGCVRLVYNMALHARTQAWTLRRERVSYNTTSAMLTGWKKTGELAFLNEVSAVPLQQALRHLQAAFANFWAKRARYPTFKSKKRSRRSAEYTTNWYGRTLIVVDRWYPSSKLCSTCGALAQKMPLNVRSWTCRCGTTHDRDTNAARNILAEGLSVTACGDGVRPQRDSSRTGQPSTKQEPPGATQGIPVR